MFDNSQNGKIIDVQNKFGIQRLRDSEHRKGHSYERKHDISVMKTFLILHSK